MVGYDPVGAVSVPVRVAAAGGGAAPLGCLIRLARLLAAAGAAGGRRSGWGWGGGAPSLRLSSAGRSRKRNCRVYGRPSGTICRMRLSRGTCDVGRLRPRPRQRRCFSSPEAASRWYPADGGEPPPRLGSGIIRGPGSPPLPCRLCSVPGDSHSCCNPDQRWSGGVRSGVGMIRPVPSGRRAADGRSRSSPETGTGRLSPMMPRYNPLAARGPHQGEGIHMDVVLGEGCSLFGQGVRSLVPREAAVGRHPLQVDGAAVLLQLQQCLPDLRP